ncbi:MAG: hypothetical protein M1816_004322 [Peltula sp. TS41687]|nr:MAG: hypothetical protein M1816_004322 [Peltula sp. TS41687]
MPWLHWPLRVQLPKRKHQPKESAAAAASTIQQINHNNVQEESNAQLATRLATTESELAQTRAELNECRAEDRRLTEKIQRMRKKRHAAMHAQARTHGWTNETGNVLVDQRWGDLSEEILLGQGGFVVGLPATEPDPVG